MLAEEVNYGDLIEMCRMVDVEGPIRDDLMVVTGLAWDESGDIRISGYFITDGAEMVAGPVPACRAMDVWTKDGLR
jgi:hypothetical protein